MAFTVGDKVKKEGGDYVYYGEVVGDILKTTGQRRLVVENGDGMLFIFNDKQLETWVA